MHKITNTLKLLFVILVQISNTIPGKYITPY